MFGFTRPRVQSFPVVRGGRFSWTGRGKGGWCQEAQESDASCVVWFPSSRPAVERPGLDFLDAVKELWELTVLVTRGIRGVL